MTYKLHEMFQKGIPLVLVFAAVGVAAQDKPAASGAQKTDTASLERIARDVYKQIVTLPQYGVFDNINFGIQGSTIILRGEASRPVLKSSAENVVKKIEGVQTVRNEIEVLPLSNNDDRIRAAVYRAIYGYPALQRYTANRGGGRYISMTRLYTGITNDPPIGWHAIHIIVKNGNVKLVGVVNTSGDMTIAEMRALQTPGVFSVDNDLMVATDENKK